MLQPRLTLVRLAPLCLTACVLPSPDPTTSPLRAPRPGERFDLPAPTVLDAGEDAASVVDASSGSDAFSVEEAIPAGPPALRLEFGVDLVGTLGSPFPLALHVHNDGPGTARELIVLAALPPELAGPDDRAVLELLRSELEPGESTSLRAPLTAHRAGLFTVDALASSLDGPIVGPVRAEVLIRELDLLPVENDEVARIEALGAILASAAQPATPLDIAAEELAAEDSARVPDAVTIRLDVLAADGTVFVGDRTDYRVRVTNIGDVERRDLALRSTLEEGLDVVSCSGATEARFEGRELHAVPLASLAPGETVEWRLVARSYRPGDGRLRFSVTCDGGSVTRNSVTTSFEEWGR